MRKPSKTALVVAIRRAAHQLADHPPVHHDPIAVPLVGNNFPRHMERALQMVGRDFRCFMAVRSRVTEDRLAEAVVSGIRQYVILGAGFDTFALRNPHAGLRVFEVDLPATQKSKKTMITRAGLRAPSSVTYVAMDFEHQTLAEGLAKAGFDASQPAYFSWLGVIPYLTLEGFRATLATVASMPKGTTLTFDYNVPREILNPLGQKAFDRLQARVAKAGEPFQLIFSPEAMVEELQRAGFERWSQIDTDDLNEMHFKDRADLLKLSPINLCRLTTAWV